MQVAMIPSSAELVGVAVHVLNLARLLRDNQLPLIVVCPTEGWLADQLRMEGISYQVLHIYYKPLYFLYSSFVLFKFLKRKESLQVVHLHGRFPLFVSLLSMIMLKNLQFVVTVHQFCGTGESGLFGWKTRLETFFLRYLIEKICCVSEALKEEILERIGSQHTDKVFVIRNWISHICGSAIKKEAHISDVKDCLRIVAVGRLSQEKGFDVLVDAIYILKMKGFSVTCDIYGDGPERAKLASSINKHSLDTYVKLQGTSNKVRYRLSQYDLLVIPSRQESFGIVVLEAYDAMVPVVASNIPGLNEIVQNEKTGLLFMPNNANSLSQQIIRLISDSKLKNSLIMQGNVFVKDFFPTKNLFRQYCQFYGVQYENI
ncbi:MAG: glycosyltransferase family 4 protein [Methanothrix sp.]